MHDSTSGASQFERLCNGCADVDLVRLMLEFAADRFPEGNMEACVAELDRLGEEARRALFDAARRSPSAFSQLKRLSELLYDEQGFHGATDEYYDPRNSYLNEVLRRRCGIPISLAIVYMAVAQRAGLDIYGVGTPGHFVLGCDADKRTWYIDPFSQGDVLRRDACRHRIERLIGQPGGISDDAFRPATAAEIAVRVLRNLKAAHALQDEWQALLPVQQRLVALLPDEPSERRDLGLIHLRCGNAPAAIRWLEPFVEQGSSDEAAQLAPYLRSAWRLLVEQN